MTPFFSSGSDSRGENSLHENKGVKIEVALLSDIDQISELNKIFRKAPDTPIKFDNPEWIMERICNFYVTRDNQGIVGHCCITIHSDHAKLDVLAVRHDMQGKGVGRALLQHAKDVARDAGVPELRVGSARRFDKKDYYLSLGFELDEGRTHSGNYEFTFRL